MISGYNSEGGISRANKNLVYPLLLSTPCKLIIKPRCVIYFVKLSCLDNRSHYSWAQLLKWMIQLITSISSLS